MRKSNFNLYLSLLVVFGALFSAMASAAVALQPTATADAQQTVTVAVAPQPESVVPVPQPNKWMQRHESMNERVKKGNVDLLVIGDSISEGWENNGKEVWNKYYKDRHAVNLGISGDQTQHVLWRLENGNIEGISPKLAMLMIGTNNANAKHSSDDIVAGVKAIVEKLREKLPRTKVLVLGIFPRGADDNDPVRQTNMKANEGIAKLADNEMVFYLDVNDKFLDSDRKLPKDIMPDLLHPNAKGYAIWAEAVEPTIVKLMGEK
ncbi:MAG: platelet-activating factor acetylhydrolase IB subunit [Thermoguttaceae bacterium]|jgi:beta-glucosidase